MHSNNEGWTANQLIMIEWSRHAISRRIHKSHVRVLAEVKKRNEKKTQKKSQLKSFYTNNRNESDQSTSSTSAVAADGAPVVCFPCVHEKQQIPPKLMDPLKHFICRRFSFPKSFNKSATHTQTCDARNGTWQGRDREIEKFCSKAPSHSTFNYKIEHFA